MATHRLYYVTRVKYPSCSYLWRCSSETTVSQHQYGNYARIIVAYRSITDIGSFHLISPQKSAKLHGSDPDFDENGYM